MPFLLSFLSSAVIEFSAEFVWNCNELNTLLFIIIICIVVMPRNPTVDKGFAVM